MGTVLIYSGGLDSTVLLYQLLRQGQVVRALSVDYGQKHAREIQAAKEITKEVGVEHRVADLRSITGLLQSSLTSAQLDIPQGHYAEENMKATVVPNRNMILLALAAGWAISLKAQSIAYAAHGGDHAVYPDCRDEFADAMAAAIRLADWHSVELVRPFINLKKPDIVRLGHELQVPFAKTWSCYRGEELHCGACGTCIERREAFYKQGIDDPTTYAAHAPATTDLIRSNWRLEGS